MAKSRLAAAVLITRESADDTQVFLVQRNPKLRFLGGYWAFPGGTLMQEDYHPADNNAGEALIRCALRELFEETGVLAGGVGAHLSIEERVHLRNELLQSTSLDNWLSLLNTTRPGYRELQTICSLVTPPFSPVIYDTRFFHHELADDQQPVIENGELVDGGFFKPDDAVSKWRRGELDIAPPVLFLLTLMAKMNFPDFRVTAENYTTRFSGGELLPVYFVPGIFISPLQTPTLPPATTTNTLIVGNDKLYLVEPATPDHDEQQRLFARIDELIGTGKKFEAILLTHYHADHVGAVNAASLKYGLPVRAHPLTYDRIEPGFIKGEPLADGDRIDLGNSPDGQPDWHLDVIHTPGHADDHLCYLESRYHSAIVGDMLSTVSTILIDPPEGHMRTYLDSLERLLDHPIKTLFPSHGPVHKDGQALIRKFLEHRRMREQKIIKALNSSVQTIEELLPRVYDDVAETSYAIAARSLLAGLIKLAEDGVCTSSGDGWTLAPANT